MIQNKEDLKYYIACDKIALKIPKKRKFPRPIIDEIWKYEINLRKLEYCKNCKKKIRYWYYNIIHHIMSNKKTVYIPPNVFGPGLSIAHMGSIVVNDNAKVGANCRIHECVTIGATNGNKKAAHIGENCFIGTGAKIIGDIEIGNNVAIGAGAVVVKDVKDNVTVGGVPAKVISRNDSSSNIIKATNIIKIGEKIK